MIPYQEDERVEGTGTGTGAATLDEAWAEVEAEIANAPDWHITDLERRSDYIVRQVSPGGRVDESRRWRVRCGSDGYGGDYHAVGPTPAAALLALAARLRESR